MEEILARAGSQAVTLALRSGINIAGGYAIGTLSKFLLKVPENDKANFYRLKERIQTKINVITPAIDLIELYSARGNTMLGQTLDMTRELKADIDEFQERIQKIEENQTSLKVAMKEVEIYAKELISRIEEAIPMITLSLTTSGANLSNSLPDSVSPGRLLQAANHLSTADTKFETLIKRRESMKNFKVQVGPDFYVKMYTFYRGAGRSVTFGEKIAWKEDYPRCRARLWRIAGPNNVDSARGKERANVGYYYRLTLEESFNDNRYHDPGDVPRSRELDVAIVTRLFFTASGRLLDIEESKSPVLVLKLNDLYGEQNQLDKVVREHDLKSASVTDEEEQYEGQEYDMYRVLDERVEWIAFEAYEEDESDEAEEDEDEEGEDEDEVEEKEEKEEGEEDEEGDEADSSKGSSTNASSTGGRSREDPTSDYLINALNDVSIQESQKSLSLLEYILRLSALQQNDQKSMYNTQDERIVLYLRDENNTRHSRTENAYQSTPASGFASNISSPGRFSTPGTPTQRSVSGSSPRVRTAAASSSSRRQSGKSIGQPQRQAQTEPRSQGLSKGSINHPNPSSPSADSVRTPIATRARAARGNHISDKETDALGTPTGQLTPWEQDKVQHSLRRNIAEQSYNTPVRGKKPR